MGSRIRMSASTSPKGLFAPTFIRDTLSQEVHRLLSLDYCRETLEALAIAPEGRSTRWIDVHVVGDKGSGKTAYILVRKLSAAGWIEERGRSERRAWFLADRGRQILEADRATDKVEANLTGIPAKIDRSNATEGVRGR